MPSDLSDALRSLRTTLLVGGLWLAAAWLLFGAALVRLGARSDLAAILHPLSRAFGSVGLGAAVSTAAYLAADRCIARALREGSAHDSYLKLLYERAGAQLALVVPLAVFFLALGWRISPFLYPLAVAGAVVGFAAVDYRRDLESEIESVI